MLRHIEFPDRLTMNGLMVASWMWFLQLLTNRRVLGALRYGDKPTKKQRYMSRMQKELDAYKETGNMENLLNIAVYCWLESEAPENKKFHFNPSIDSVTRREFGT